MMKLPLGKARRRSGVKLMCSARMLRSFSSADQSKNLCMEELFIKGYINLANGLWLEWFFFKKAIWLKLTPFNFLVKFLSIPRRNAGVREK